MPLPGRDLRVVRNFGNIEAVQPMLTSWLGALSVVAHEQVAGLVPTADLLCVGGRPRPFPQEAKLT